LHDLRSQRLQGGLEGHPEGTRSLQNRLFLAGLGHECGRDRPKKGRSGGGCTAPEPHRVSPEIYRNRMRYFVLATDYDGTLAHDGIVSPVTIAALEQLRATGRKLILVSGRELGDLLRVFPRIELFDRVVAENGALIYTPATREEQPLGEAPPEALVAALRTHGVEPLSVGRVIIATWHPNEIVVLKTIRDLGLEHQVIFNKGAVMVLPAGINKAAGLGAAL